MICFKTQIIVMRKCFLLLLTIFITNCTSKKNVINRIYVSSSHGISYTYRFKRFNRLKIIYDHFEIGRTVFYEKYFVKGDTLIITDGYVGSNDTLLYNDSCLRGINSLKCPFKRK